MSIETVAQRRRQVCCQPLTCRCGVAKLFLARRKRSGKLRHCFWASYKIVFDVATVDRFSISFPQPFDQRRARAAFPVVAVACDEWLAFDRGDKCAVLLQRTVNQEKTFARQ